MEPAYVETNFRVTELRTCTKGDRRRLDTWKEHARSWPTSKLKAATPSCAKLGCGRPARLGIRVRVEGEGISWHIVPLCRTHGSWELSVPMWLKPETELVVE